MLTKGEQSVRWPRKREKMRLVVTKNALDKLEEAVAFSGMTPEVTDPRHFSVPIDEGSVHQGAALEVKPLHWGSLADVCIDGKGAPLAGARRVRTCT